MLRQTIAPGLPASAPHHLLILFESESACRQRLAAAGFSSSLAAEVAIYLSQATDLAAYTDRLRTAFAPLDMTVDFFELGDHARYLPRLQQAPAQTMLWSLTDGFRYYRGSFTSSLAALLGVKTFGSGPQAQHLCQDKYKSALLAQAAGIRIPTSALARNGDWLTPPPQLAPEATWFVRPNTLGSKLGIWPDSRCTSLAAALALSKRIWQRYGDTALVQSFIPGYDVRVSFMAAVAPGVAARLGVYRLSGVENSETGGAFMTMQDNFTLSASRGAGETEIASPFDQPATFQPRPVNLAQNPAQATLVKNIEAQVAALARLLDLRDYYSVDFRVGDHDELYLLEFEVCPAVTIYDFQTYLTEAYGLDLPGALARAIPTAFAAQS